MLWNKRGSTNGFCRTPNGKWQSALLLTILWYAPQQKIKNWCTYGLFLHVHVMVICAIFPWSNWYNMLHQQKFVCYWDVFVFVVENFSEIVKYESSWEKNQNLYNISIYGTVYILLCTRVQVSCSTHRLGRSTEAVWNVTGNIGNDSLTIIASHYRQWLLWEGNIGIT